MAPATSDHLLVLGVHLKSEGYPNTLYRLSDLQSSGQFQMTEINAPMWHESSQGRRGISRIGRNLGRAIAAHGTVLLRYLAAGRRARVYVPYPAVFVLLLLSWLPRRLRPRHIVADVFISLYDTIVLDRRLLAPGGLPARVLKWVEHRAYLVADKLVVDTPQNVRFLCSLFALPEEKAVAIPLSINEGDFRYTAYVPRPGICRVLFVGTMVPLHGIQTILEAARLLSGRPDIHFRLIGDGEDASLIEAGLGAGLPNFFWERKWQPSSRIAQEISQADICLGIFGAGDKTQRVCPFKLYAYASIGRAIITAETLWLRESGAAASGAFASVPVSNAEALAEKIVQLAGDPLLRMTLAENSHEFYQTHLGNRRALEKLSPVVLFGGNELDCISGIFKD